MRARCTISRLLEHARCLEAAHLRCHAVAKSTTVDITPAALDVSMDTQIALGTLAAQPVYDKLIATSYIKKALETK